MSKILDGNLVSDKIYRKIKPKIIKLQKKGVIPTLAVILVGKNPPSVLYTKIKKEKAKEIGIKTISINLSQNVKNYFLINEIEKLNKNNKIQAILIQLPLPKHIDTNKILSVINQKKDVDVLNLKNFRKIKNKKDLLPPTPAAIIEILKYYKINFKNKQIVIIGYGKLVGKPLFYLLKKIYKVKKLIAITSKTKNFTKLTQAADIIISAAGYPNLINENHIKKGVILIDAGVKKINGKVQGDVNFIKVFKKCSYITPPTGGVGPVTVAKLLENVVNLTKLNNDR